MGCECLPKAVGMCLTHYVRRQRWSPFPRKPLLPAMLEHQYFQFHFKAVVFGARIHIAQSYRLKVPDGEPRICLDWLIFLSLELSCWLGLTVRLVWPLEYKVLSTYEPGLCRIRQSSCFLLRLHRPICKVLAMFNKIWSVRLKVCNQSQRFCISWLSIGDGVSCCGKGHADSITALGRCGHA